MPYVYGCNLKAGLHHGYHASLGYKLGNLEASLHHGYHASLGYKLGNLKAGLHHGVPKMTDEQHTDQRVHTLRQAHNVYALHTCVCAIVIVRRHPANLCIRKPRTTVKGVVCVHAHAHADACTHMRA